MSEFGLTSIWQAGASNKSQKSPLSPRSSSSPGYYEFLGGGSLSDLRPESLSISHRLTLLENEIRIKDSKIDTLNAKIGRLEDEVVVWRGRKSGTWVSTDGIRKSSEVTIGTTTMSPSVTDIDMSFTSVGEEIQRRKHEIAAISHTINDNGRTDVRIATRNSIYTSNVLETMPEMRRSREEILAERFLRVFQNPEDFLTYLTSVEFADDLAVVCQAVSQVLESEPRCSFLQSPVYVIGDIHGNLEDLHFFADNVWKLGVDLTAGKFLFLGDYVDRGLSSLECVAYLFGLKLLYPNKVFLLRGNHETRNVNGWEQHYKEKSFLYQCKLRFGAEKGVWIWEECNKSFDRLPLSAVIDHEIFCIHGGIPRPVAEHPTEVQAILSVPSVASVMPAAVNESAWSKQVCSDCLWSDPASDEMERILDESGFGDSPRGGGAVCFGNAAIDSFLLRNECSYIIRAHEAHSQGVSLSKGARVFTVFSTSKDHRQGSMAMAGCILVDFDKIQVINRSPKYKNKYVHRRSSVSLENLSSEEISERQKVGLIRNSIGPMPPSTLPTGENQNHFPHFGI